jgi:hypothetical protein
MKKTFLFILYLAACAGGAVAAEPTSPGQRAEMIHLINGLETRPYGPEADNSRKAVMEWLTDAPDVSVTICGALLGDIEKLENEKDDPGLLLQLLFAEARFILEHPDQSKDEHAVHLAGVDGALVFYSAMKAERPAVRIDMIEKIVRVKSDGKLSDHVRKAMDKCN